MKKTIAKAIGTSFGFGFIPWAPGTWGAAFGVAIYYLIYQFASEDINAWMIGLTIVFTIIGTWCCEVLKDEWGDDPNKIVMDESIGIWLTFISMPYGWFNILLGFGLFRFFDILKPLGVGAIDRKIKNGFGVMADDLLAGVYAFIVLQAANYFGLVEYFGS